ncbi:efflux RND transporter periplasmic adaptor subunit [Flavobacterium silvaticum]|uniref:Efflux RND transporter periplasmic adaptor subunit n=1 Tax=Flavobacterium silvaticum TaxID=1852020 RepID=A0A972JG87_9FLAO|nr:efflux RND transporter periplasmic adaptor subunit [Flavobacterium silvaticum]NMH27941.1 efflux RND transporter periplasmic adaptor subunit [Flavobacterium silvaticum]
MKRIFLLLTIGVVFSACHKKQDTQLSQTFVLSDKMLGTTKTVEAKLLPLKNEDTFYGKITSDNNKTIEVYPVVGGSVTKVYVELGDYVKKNQLLATIKSTDVASFEQQLEDAKNDVIVTRNNYKVAQELFEGKLNSERDVVQAKSEYEKAKSQLQRVEENYNIYHIKSGSIYEVRSPLNGFITEKKINENMLLRGDRTDNIFDIAEINEVWAIAHVNEGDINRVREGESAQITTLSYPDKIYDGKVDKIFNIIDPETKAMKVVIRLQNPGFELKPEMRAGIKLSYEEKGNKMIAVPSDAVIFDKSHHFVMVFKDRNNIETRQVEVFRQVGKITYISSGLTENEKVMTTNQLLVYDALND